MSLKTLRWLSESLKSLGQLTNINGLLWAHGKTLVFSDVTLKVNEDLFGQYDQKEITVRIMGGETPNMTHVSSDDASFDKNEHVLVFVAGPEPDSIWGDNYYVAGLELGKYKIEDGKAKQSDKELYDEIELKSKIKKYRADKIN